MKAEHHVHNLIILDESGSMSSIQDTIIKGFNELVQTIQGIQQEFPDQSHSISMISFNGLGQKYLHFMEPVNKLQEINSHSYVPQAFTPLFDAMGSALNRLKEALSDQKDYNVLVTILTDGEENASREFSGSTIKEMVEELSAENWTFTYIGTDHDVEKIASSLSIKNTMTFEKNSNGIERMFAMERQARFQYSRKIDLNEEISLNYFDLENDPAENN